MILADTSVWIGHFRHASRSLQAALEREEVLTHPFVIGELACGHLRRRSEVLALLAALPSSSVATDEETLAFIESRRLMGKGIGWVDAHLLAAVMLTEGGRLWTRDRKLASVAAQLQVGFAGA